MLRTSRQLKIFDLFNLSLHTPQNLLGLVLALKVIKERLNTDKNLQFNTTRVKKKSKLMKLASRKRPNESDLRETKKKGNKNGNSEEAEFLKF